MSTIYKVTQEDSISNPIVKKLNANVAIKTFNQHKRIQLGDIYSSANECDLIVGHSTCPPINGTFVGTVYLFFPNMY